MITMDIAVSNDLKKSVYKWMVDNCPYRTKEEQEIWRNGAIGMAEYLLGTEKLNELVSLIDKIEWLQHDNSIERPLSKEERIKIILKFNDYPLVYPKISYKQVKYKQL